MDMMEFRKREVAQYMLARDLQPWHASDVIKTMAFPITRAEEEELIRKVKKELQKLQNQRG